MTWIPDWDNLDRKELTLHYFDEEYGEVLTETAEFSNESSDTFRLLQHPLLMDEKFRWGDLIKATRIDWKH